MKILFLGEYFPSEIVPAPIKVGKELLKEFRKTGHQIYYLPYYQDGKIYSRVQKLFGFEKITDRVYRVGIFPLILFVTKFRPEIIHIITPALYYIVLFPFRKILGFKIVSTLHSINHYVLPKLSDIYGYQRIRFLFIEKLLIKFSDFVFVYTERDKRYLTIYHKILPLKLSVMNNGINLSDITKTDFSLGTTLKIAFVGNIKRREKAFEFLINALAKLKFPVTLSIFSFNSQSEKIESPSFNIIIRTYEPLDEINFRQELIKNDLYIISSVYESFSISLLEAMNAGMIFLASSRVGLTERFGEKLRHLVFKSNNQQDLLNHIELVCKMDEEAKRDLSFQVKEFTKNYVWASIAEEYYKIYNEVLAV